MKTNTQNNKGLVYYINDTNKKELEGMDNVVYSEGGTFALVYTKEILTEAKFQQEALNVNIKNSLYENERRSFVDREIFKETDGFLEELGECWGKILKEDEVSITFNLDQNLPIVSVFNIMKFENDIVECEIIAQFLIAIVNDKKSRYAKKFVRTSLLEQ